MFYTIRKQFHDPPATNDKVIKGIGFTIYRHKIIMDKLICYVDLLYVL